MSTFCGGYTQRLTPVERRYTQIVNVNDMISLLFAGRRFVVTVTFIEVFVRFKSVDLRINVNVVVDVSTYTRFYPIS